MSPPPSLAAAFASKRVRLILLFIALSVVLLAFTAYSPLSLREGATGLFASSPPSNDTSEPDPAHEEHDTATDWSRFAYGQYVTNSLYLCNSVMFFAMLQKLGSKADRIIMYPSNMLPNPEVTTSQKEDGRLLIKARDKYNVKLSPITISHKEGSDPTWEDSFTKLLVFNQTQYDRVLSLDSDSTLLQHMDELFLLPSATLAIPRAYWLFPQERVYSSQLILVEPSKSEFARIQRKIKSSGPNDYDMEIMNQLYGASALIIPHRPYTMLTGELREKDHAMYLGNPEETWDPVLAFNEAKFVHFSDYPVPKPWLPVSEQILKENQPDCIASDDGSHDCSARDIWRGFYKDFKARRQEVCRLR